MGYFPVKLSNKYISKLKKRCKKYQESVFILRKCVKIVRISEKRFFHDLIENCCNCRKIGEMADQKASDDSLYPIAVLIDELKNEDIQVRLT